MRRKERIRRRIVYLELLDPFFDSDGGSARVRSRIRRDFPWVSDEGWEIERWGLRGSHRPPATEAMRLRGIRMPFRVFPRVLLPVVVWVVQFVLSLRRPRAGIMIAYSPLMGVGVAAARLFRPSSVLVIRIIESVTSRAQMLYRHRVEARVLRATERFALRRADLVIPMSRFTYEAALQAGVRKDRIVVLPHPPPPWDRPAATSTDAQANPIRVVSAGRLVPEKGFDELILAFAELAEDHPDVVLEVAGDGPQRGPLESLAMGLRIRERVTFHGWLSAQEMGRFFGGALVAVLPSRVEEGLPRMLLEAGMANCALVGTDLGGIRDIVEPGRTGILVPPNDPLAIADALRRLLRSPGEARRLGAAARARSLEYFAKRETALQSVRKQFNRLLGC